MHIHYPFHPLHGQDLRVFVAARSPDGAVTVEDAKQKRLKIPLWMVSPDARQFTLSDAPTLDAHALLRILELYELQRDKLPELEVHPQTELTHEATLVVRTAARERIDADS